MNNPNSNSSLTYTTTFTLPLPVPVPQPRQGGSLRSQGKDFGVLLGRISGRETHSGQDTSVLFTGVTHPGCLARPGQAP